MHRRVTQIASFSSISIIHSILSSFGFDFTLIPPSLIVSVSPMWWSILSITFKVPAISRAMIGHATMFTGIEFTPLSFHLNFLWYLLFILISISPGFRTFISFVPLLSTIITHSFELFIIRSSVSHVSIFSHPILSSWFAVRLITTASIFHCRWRFISTFVPPTWL